jgi:kynureninase
MAHISASAVSDVPSLRHEFAIPRHGQQDQHYFCGNSLGLMPKAAFDNVNSVLRNWQHYGVEGHFLCDSPWLPFHETVRAGLADITGAKPEEVVAMNTLTANLHLLMVSFFRPSKTRTRILIEGKAFPSDRYAVSSQLQWHGLDDSHLIELFPEPGEDCLQPARILEAIEAAGDTLALVLFPGVQYATGQAFDLRAITQAAHRVGALAGFDLAHAIGNVELALHDSGADFAVWCSYKYLNSGPGAIAGAFVHERHRETDRPRLAGWWGHRVADRFKMGPTFQATPGADGWQLSNPPILSLAPLQSSLALFQQLGMPALRQRSLQLTGYLEQKLLQLAPQLSVITPKDPAQRGCQLSVRIAGQHGKSIFQALTQRGVIGDWREPDIIRFAPTPLYNEFSDIDALIEQLSGLLQ